MGETKEKRLKAKVVHKHETAANWELSNYIPDVGEIVFYDPDEEYGYTRQKNGDGIHKVSELPFSAEQKLDANGWTSENGELSFEIDAPQDEWTPGTESINIAVNGIDIRHEIMVDGSDHGNSVSLGANGISVHNNESSAYIQVGSGMADEYINIHHYNGSDTYYRQDKITIDDKDIAFPEKSGTLALQEDITEALGEVENTKQDKLPANLFSVPVVWGPNNKKNKCLIGRFFIKGNYKAIAVNNNKLNITGINGTSFKLGTATDYVKPTNEQGYAVLFNVARMFTMAEGKYAQYITTESIYSTKVEETTIFFYWTYPYYIKRISAEEGKDGTSAGPDTGIVTTETYFKKWRDGIINTGSGDDKIAAYKEYLLKFYVWNVIQGEESGSILQTAPTLATANTPKFQLTAVTENREAFSHTLAARNGLGQLIVNDATAPFQAVNKKQLDKEIQTVNNSINSVNTALTNNINNVNTALNTRINTKTAFRTSSTMTISADKYSSGKRWVKIAESNSAGHFSELFNLFITGSYASLITFIVNIQETNGEDATIDILSVCDRDYSPSSHNLMIDEIAIICNKNESSRSIYVHFNYPATSDKSIRCDICSMALTKGDQKWQLLTSPEVILETLPQGNKIYKYSSDVYILPKIRIVDSLPTERRADTLYFSKS